MKRVIIQGSSRSDGNTHKIVRLLMDKLDFDFIDLKKKNIAHFDYDFQNQTDDFLPTIREIADQYDVIVFATPVYWYSMSGIMKAFFDRISDCLKIEKETGRKLKGKKMALLICGSDAEETEGFEIPFRESAHYLGMEYLGYVYTWVGNGEEIGEVEKRVEGFSRRLIE